MHYTPPGTIPAVNLLESNDDDDDDDDDSVDNDPNRFRFSEKFAIRKKLLWFCCFVVFGVDVDVGVGVGKEVMLRSEFFVLLRLVFTGGCWQLFSGEKDQHDDNDPLTSRSEKEGS